MRVGVSTRNEFVIGAEQKRQSQESHYDAGDDPTKSILPARETPEGGYLPPLRHCRTSSRSSARAPARRCGARPTDPDEAHGSVRRQGATPSSIRRPRFRSGHPVPARRDMPPGPGRRPPANSRPRVAPPRDEPRRRRAGSGARSASGRLGNARFAGRCDDRLRIRDRVRPAATPDCRRR